MTLEKKQFSEFLYLSILQVPYSDIIIHISQFSGCHGNHEITAMTFDPTHRRLLTAAKDGSIKIWNFNNGALLGELQVCQAFNSLTTPL